LLLDFNPGMPLLMIEDLWQGSRNAGAHAVVALYFVLTKDPVTSKEQVIVTVGAACSREFN